MVISIFRELMSALKGDWSKAVAKGSILSANRRRQLRKRSLTATHAEEAAERGPSALLVREESIMEEWRT